MRDPESVFAAQVSRHVRRLPSDASARRGLAALFRNSPQLIGTSLKPSDEISIADPSVPLVEVAHDGQLPHLGIIRLVLKTAQIAKMVGGVAIYLIGDHYTASMRPRNILLGIPLRGKDPDSVKQPIRLPIHGRDREVPFTALPPPTSNDLAHIQDRAWDWFEKNVAHERTRGRQVRDVEGVRDRMSFWFRSLTQAVRSASSMGTWLTRVQLQALDSILEGNPLPVIVLSMSEFRKLVERELRDVVSSLSASTIGEESRLWMFCPACRVRSPPEVRGDRVRLRCPRCSTETDEPLDPSSPNQFPDIVAYEAAALGLFSGWVVGSSASYLHAIDEAFHQKTGMDPCPRAVLSSIPVFRGVGEPVEGYGRSRVLRVLFELDGPALLGPLLAPWNENPRILSPHLLLSRPPS